MSRTTLITASALTLALTALCVQPAAARGHSTSIQGSGGAGLTRSTSAVRTSSGMSSAHSVQTNGGYGASTSRNATYGDGAYSSSSQTQFNNGAAISRSASAQANGDGTASYQASRTGVNGKTTSVSGTVSHTGPQ